MPSNFPYDFAQTRAYTLGAPKQLVPTEDGRFVLFLRAGPRDPKQSLWETDLASGQTRELLRPDAVKPEGETLSPEELARRERQRINTAGFTSFEVTRDASKVLVSLSGRLYVFARASGEVRELPTGRGAALDPHLSPDGTRVAYVREFDIYVVPLEGGKEAAVTRGGSEMRTHGLAEYIAQEELGRSRGFWWSPDGADILYEDADLSPVQKWTITDPAHPEKAPDVRPYPRAGTSNAIVRLAIAAVPGGVGNTGNAKGVRPVTWDDQRYPYLATASWSKNAPPTIYVLDRVQQNSALFAIDAQTGATHALLTEQDPAWINVDASVPRWLPDGSGFLWSTERHGAWELELRDARGEPRSTLVAPALGYREVLAIDGDKRVAYLTASRDPTRSELWAAPLDGTQAPHVVAKLDDGMVHARFGEGAQVYSFSESTRGGERRFGARQVDGSGQVSIPSAAAAPPFKPQVEYATVGDEGFHVAIVRPHGFDPKQRYPLIDAVYGGPHVNVVTSDGLSYLRAQWIADVADAIVVAIDVQGTMWRGRAWERKLRDRLGDTPLDGHVAAIGALAKAYPEIDATRVGVYGWSFGGYLTSLAVLRRPDVFKVGVAGAPTVDLTDYDTCYTERYLGVPPNPAYESASVLTWAARPPSEAMPARPFLLVHGTADDNVYFSNSLKLAATMGRVGRPVEFVPIVGVTHMLYAPEIAGPVWTRMANFLRDHL
ncbi:MAG TPA: DPP IV N-terminal domain-containing protein [Polyangiaceae bacterium]|nr:DPP IV N-terminal domain-containing protein [Polyangiaceae bacterium]